MTRTRSALIAGVVVAAYVALATWSGSLSVVYRRPLLDGFSQLVYRWVTPPPELASTNVKPDALSKTLDLAQPDRGAGLHGTGDRQAELVLDPGTFPASAGKPKLTLAITPLDPATINATPPSPMTVTGNAYRFALTRKDGKPAPPFAAPAHLVLVYPIPTVFVQKHTILRLSGSSWTEVKTTDAPAAQQAAADVTTLGTYVVGVIAPSPSPTPSPKGTAATGIIVGGAVVVVAGLAAAYAWQVRRKAARRKAKRRGPRKPPPKRR